MNKERCHIETINDLDEDVTNFFLVLRDESPELERRIRLTPYSRDEYKKAYEFSEDRVERARRFMIRCWMGFGCGNVYQNGFRSGQQKNSPNPAKAWSGLEEIMILMADRLQGVQIENLPAIELIKRYRTADVLIYADPPYLPDFRKKYLYKHEMSTADHIELLETLLKHPGPVIVSGYDNEMYDQYLKG